MPVSPDLSRYRATLAINASPASLESLRALTYESLSPIPRPARIRDHPATFHPIRLRVSLLGVLRFPLLGFDEPARVLPSNGLCVSLLLIREHRLQTFRSRIVPFLHLARRIDNLIRRRRVTFDIQQTRAGYRLRRQMWCANGCQHVGNRVRVICTEDYDIRFIHNDKVVGTVRIELTNPCSQNRCVKPLRYVPIKTELMCRMPSMTIRAQHSTFCNLAGDPPQRES
jgi:hypothetical protein